MTDSEQVQQALLEDDPKLDVKRYFHDHPFVDDDANKTYVVKNQMGPQHRATLTLLTESFPDAKVSYRRADADN